MPTPCPPDDVLGALVQQALPDFESERVRSHIDECDACSDAVVAAVRGRVMSTDLAPTLAIGTPSFPRITLGQPATMIGGKIGRYDVRALLGAGGMGHVYEAYDAELDRAIALKVLRPELTVAQTLTDRLVRESRLMAKVSHPAVITVYDVGRDGDTVFIAMELIRGETLGSYLARRRPSWREIVELFERAGAGLAAAHRAGIVHRDFKPDNVLVEVDGDVATRVVVTDFGIARATGGDDIAPSIAPRKSDPRITSTGTAVGTPAYMAPEQLAGEPVDLRADVFAFCASLWEALFGERPFPGTSVEQIRSAMLAPPRAPSAGPRSVVDVLERGLAIERADRWQDMQALVRVLASKRTRARRVKLVAGVSALVAAGVASAALIARPASEDPCARATLHYDAAGLRSAIADPAVRETIAKDVEKTATAWRTTHAATCKADRHPIQAPQTTACLDARKLELESYVADVIADRGVFATDFSALLGDPTKCSDPAPGLLVAKMPADPMLRRRVTALRARAFATQAARDRGEFKTALADAAQLVEEAKLTWPLVHAETLYLYGTCQSLGGDTKLALPTLRTAAAVAETAHHDYIAANAWIQLALGTTFDLGAPERGLEYAKYADAAIDRLGRPPFVTSMYEYVKGATLVELSRMEEAETSLRRAVELAEKNAVEILPQAIQGLGYLYEAQGRFADAVDAYRRALDKLPKEGAGAHASAIVFRQRLAVNLSLLGQLEEAERMAREGVALADKWLPPENNDRMTARANLAEVLQETGDYAGALAEARASLADVAKYDGERSSRYADVLQIEADILHNLKRDDEAEQRFARACDIRAFHDGDTSVGYADCLLASAIAKTHAGGYRVALARVEKALPTLLENYGEPHPQTANAFLMRGIIAFELGRAAASVPDLERSLTAFEQIALDKGHLASAQYALARALWTTNRERSRSLLEAAIANYEHAGATWAEMRAEVAEWRTTNGKPKRR